MSDLSVYSNVQAGARAFSDFRIPTPERLRAMGSVVESVEAVCGTRIPASSALDATLGDWLDEEVFDLDQMMMTIGAMAVVQGCLELRKSDLAGVYLKELERFGSVPRKIMGNVIDGLMCASTTAGDKVVAKRLYRIGHEQGALRHDMIVLHGLNAAAARVRSGFLKAIGLYED